VEFRLGFRQSKRRAYRNTRRCLFSRSSASWCFLCLATLAGHREVHSTSSTIGRLLSCLSPISLPQYITGYATVRASTKLCPWYHNGIVSGGSPCMHLSRILTGIRRWTHDSKLECHLVDCLSTSVSCLRFTLQTERTLGSWQSTQARGCGVRRKPKTEPIATPPDVRD